MRFKLDRADDDVKVQVLMAPGEEPHVLELNVAHLKHFMGLLQMALQSQLFGFETELTLTPKDR